MKDFVQNINHQFYDFVLKYDTTNDNIKTNNLKK